MNDIRPLPIWSARPLTEADYGRIRAAKQRLNLPFLVQFGRAVAGTYERVLAIGGDPPFLCDYAGIPHTTSAGLDQALSWVLGDHEDARAMKMADVLSKWLGGKVTEVTDADLEQTAGQRDDRLGSDPESVQHPERHDDNDGPADRGRTGSDHGPRGRRDPGQSDERPYRNFLREIRKTSEEAATVG